MERQVIGKMPQKSNYEFDEDTKMKNLLLSDRYFCEKFKDEWNEITAMLRQISQANKAKKESTNRNESYRPTSSSLVFK